MSQALVGILNKIQKELKAPKSQYNSFAKFHYRNCDDILESVKKVMPDDVIVTVSDCIEIIGDRYYVKATAAVQFGAEVISCSAYAREPLSKKGMDEAQVTGATSSYARKYALNGLFLIDDSKDVDSNDNRAVPAKDGHRMTMEKDFTQLCQDLFIKKETIEKWKEKEELSLILDASDDYLNTLIMAMRKKQGESKNV